MTKFKLTLPEKKEVDNLINALDEFGSITGIVTKSANTAHSFKYFIQFNSSLIISALVTEQQYQYLKALKYIYPDSPDSHIWHELFKNKPK